MAQQSHVPKFGNWDGDNIPYTAYFENARKERATGGKMMNPNDPEENPEAFMFVMGGAGSDAVSPEVQAPPRLGSDKSVPAEKYRAEGHKQGHQRNTSDQQKSVSLKSITSESGSDKSSSDYSLVQANHRRARSDRKKSNSIVEGNSFCMPSPGPNRLRSGNNPSDDMSFRSAAVPRFGAWDETDPKSGEGFTVIFNKVKEEKQIAASKFPAVIPQASNYPNSQIKDTQSKRCCCLF